jgi:hypothetical protein
MLGTKLTIRACVLSFQESKLILYLGTADLRIPGSGLNGWRTFHGHVPRVIGNFFQRPLGFTHAMSKIMAQIVKAEIRDEFPLLMVRLLLKGAKPVVNAVLAQSLIPLGGEDVGTSLIATSMLQVSMKRAACLVQEVDIAELSAFMPDVQPTNFWADMRISSDSGKSEREEKTLNPSLFGNSWQKVLLPRVFCCESV